jgi:hypothetical protein
VKRFPVKLPLSLVLLLLGVPALLLSQASPTPQGEMSAAEKAAYHGKLYKNYRTGKNLRELAAKGSGDVVVTATVLRGIGGGDPNAPRSPYPNSYLKEIAWKADAVVVVVMRTSFANLTEDGDFIFTDCQMTVEEVIKDNPAAPLHPTQEITVTRPGGTLMPSRGRTVQAVDPRFPPFHHGQRFLLFLRYIPVTGAYRALADWSFELVGEGPRRGAHILAPRPPWTTLENASDPNAFVTEVRMAVREMRP